MSKRDFIIIRINISTNNLFTMKNFITKSFFLLLMLLTFAACGQKEKDGEAKDYFEETQNWTKFDNKFVELSSYNTNKIDGKSFAMLIHLQDWTESEVGQMLFILYNVDGSMSNKDDHDVKVKEGLTSVNIKLDILDETYDLEAVGMGNSFTVVLQNTPEDRQFFNVLARGIFASKETTITAPLENGKEYSWNFHSYLDMGEN